MKKTFFYLLILPFNFCLAQNYSSTLSVNDIVGDHAVFGVKSENSGKSLKYDEIAGSPYFDKNFYNAKVANDYGTVPIRYNSYKDEIEFENEGKPLVLPKDPKFYKIELLSPKKTIVYLNTEDNLTGYFFEIVDGKNILYKKVKTKFIDSVPAANSYATDKPASFKQLDPIYYIKANNRFIKSPKSQKDIINSFSDKKDEIEGFFKSNKIKFNKEEDLIKLTNFLNSI
ncbi:hypothetical protein [uncultured Chryseobacterium sp.]|uniref:hypothetical protein n=1 Tax=uncultured Chryseobacterium sp. TaxID=259322 RepID=UPI0025FB9D53|nr:hypothetical protein [uncultured Chryseobacterium sp.]